MASLGKTFSNQLSDKRRLIDKANAYLIVATVIATVVVVLSIFVCIELINKISYQAKVLQYRDVAVKQLEQNIDAVKDVKASYDSFESATESMIGTPDKNSKITLDALPSKYDFPALITSLEYITSSSGLKVDSIDATDDEINAKKSDLDPKAQEIPFTLSASGTYDNIQKFINNLQKSIRPIKINKIEISGENTNIKVFIEGITYYQPSKELGITEQQVKSNKPFKLDQPNSNTNTNQKTTGGSQ